ncbi:MAG: hypothetical protein GY754_38365 [bacterium]|nr:hypothetical protein [bacterium]
MKLKITVFLISILCFCVNSCSKPAELSLNILKDGRWYNDEFDFIFNKDMTYKSHYTFGKENGTMTGTFEFNKDSKDNAFYVKKGAIKNKYNSAVFTSEKIKFIYVYDPANPKSTRLLKDENNNIVLWNEEYFQKPDAAISMEPGKVSSVVQGYKLSSTTDNVRIRKGPGINHKYMTFHYKDLKTNNMKSHPAVLSGTNIRILARTVEKMKISNWNNFWYYIEYKEPKNNFLVYKTAWMYGEFIYVQGDKNRMITIKSPQNEASFYSTEDRNIEGEVTGNPDTIKIQLKNAYGNVTYEEVLTDYKRREGTFSYTLSKEKKTLFIGSNIYNFVAKFNDGKTVSNQVTVYFHEYAGEMAKPVIYLYPQEEMEISVSVNPVNGISVSDPEYSHGWFVTSNPQGEIVDKKDGKEYPYLYWESSNYPPSYSKEGFVVEKNKLCGFFKDKLSILGLNDQEIKDFNEFWIPILSNSKYYFINFYDQKEIDAMAPLEIYPAPDSIIRVFFDSKKLDKPIKVKEQKLAPVKRKGFSVVEWGGMRY